MIERRRAAMWLVAGALGLALSSACSASGGGYGDATTTAATATDTPAPTSLAQGGGSAAPPGIVILTELTHAGVEQRVNNLVDAYNKGDAPAFRALFTDRGFAEFSSLPLPASPADLAAALAGTFNSGAPVELRHVYGISTAPGTAGARALLAIGHSLSIDAMTFVDYSYRGRGWMVNQYTEGAESVAVPDGTVTVDITLDDFSFEFDALAIPSDGNVAFNLSNHGSQAHEMVLLQLAAGVDFPAVFTNTGPSGPLPTGVTLYAVGIVPVPGDESTVVFTGPIPAGRYGIVCFQLDVNDPGQAAPQLLKGMTAEFTVG